MVVTRTIRNRFVGDELARGFESHRLRQGLLEGFILQGVLSFSLNPFNICGIIYLSLDSV